MRLEITRYKKIKPTERCPVCDGAQMIEDVMKSEIQGRVKYLEECPECKGTGELVRKRRIKKK